MIARDISVVQGDDYASADSRALVFTGAGENWPDLTSATFSLKARAVNGTETLVTASGTRSLVSGIQYITVPLTAAQTAALPKGSNSAEYDLQAVISSRRLTLAKGYITVKGAAA